MEHNKNMTVGLNKQKLITMCYNAITASALSYLSELLHLYCPSRSLGSSSDISIAKPMASHFSHFSPQIWISFPQDIRLFSLPSKANSSISFLRILHLSNTVLQYNVYVCILHIDMSAEPLLMCTLSVSCLLNCRGNILFLDLRYHSVCQVKLCLFSGLSRGVGAPQIFIVMNRTVQKAVQHHRRREANRFCNAS